MSVPPPDAAHVSDMLGRARLAVAAARSMSPAQLAADDLPTLALERLVEIVGEAARRVSPSMKAMHPEIPWTKIVATRNIIAHDYGDVAYDVLWRIVTVHLPELIEQLEPLSPRLPPDPEPEPE